MSNDDAQDPGYQAALNQAGGLAAELLRLALVKDGIRCVDCDAWAGRCMENIRYRLALSEICEKFRPRPGGKV